MTTTYEMIRALPAKSFDWTAFNAALRAEYVTLAGRNVESYIARTSLENWDNAKGMRAIRAAAMEMACSIVHSRSISSNIIAPSQETRMWDSFEGGHHNVWNDADAMEIATQEIASLITSLRK